MPALETIGFRLVIRESWRYNARKQQVIREIYTGRSRPQACSRIKAATIRLQHPVAPNRGPADQHRTPVALFDDRWLRPSHEIRLQRCLMAPA